MQMKQAQADVLGEEKLMRGKVEMEMVLEMEGSGLQAGHGRQKRVRKWEERSEEMLHNKVNK